MADPVLAFPDHAKPFEVHTDVSDYAIGGVLMQEGHPITYESRKLNDTERKYTVQEKEMTACTVYAFGDTICSGQNELSERIT